MAYEITAAQYKDEWIHVFQRGDTYLKDCVKKETVVEGTSSAVFAIAGVSSGMSSRGANGLIPTRNATDTQVTFNLKERHSLENQTKFNVFTSQSGKLREAMQHRSRMDSTREIDDEIMLGLNTATTQWSGGSAVAPTLGVISDIISDLWEANAGDGVCCVWTPKTWAKIRGLSEFNSADYVDKKALMGDAMRPVYWNNATHFVHTGLTGMGTATAKNYVFAKSAVGHCIASGEIDIGSGFNDEHAYSWDRATIYHVSGILQQAGVIEVTTDDTVTLT